MLELIQAKETVQRISNAVAAALKVEVEIIDFNLVRVAGTGKVHTEVGSRLLRGLVNKHVLKTGEHVFISEPGRHPICRSCPLADNCFYLAYLVYPIRANDKVIGTISLVAFDEGQKQTLTGTTETLVDFVGRMADLLAVKVGKREMIKESIIMTNRLEAVVDSVYEGVMTIDEEGIITRFNRSAEKMFGVKKEQVIGKPVQEVMGNQPLLNVLKNGRGFTSREYHINFKGRKLHFWITARPVHSDENGSASVVATFRNFQDAQKLAYQIVSNQEWLGFGDIIGNSEAINAVKFQAVKIARSNSTVLIVGESGTGKELFARAIHHDGPRSQKPFIPINCGAIPEHLLESELFGYEEGAFTGARKGGKPGKFELANEGTLFLDEIGNMSLYLQAKLLRVLQERQVERVGGTRVTPLDIRVIAATNSDLQDMVQKGHFREDLYYRLSVIPLVIPPLRERPEDILLLLKHYLRRYSKLLGKNIQGYTEEALKICREYSWPGNVRELINAVEYAVNLEEERLILPESLPPRLKQNNEDRPLSARPKEIKPLEQLEREAIKKALNNFGWSDEGKVQAARALGISRATIYRKINKYRLHE